MTPRPCRDDAQVVLRVFCRPHAFASFVQGVLPLPYLTFLDRLSLFSDSISIAMFVQFLWASSLYAGNERSGVGEHGLALGRRWSHWCAEVDQPPFVSLARRRLPLIKARQAAQEAFRVPSDSRWLRQVDPGSPDGGEEALAPPSPASCQPARAEQSNLRSDQC